MGALEEVLKMQQQGKSENEIFDSLRQNGYSAKDVYDAISQTKIKTAVEAPQDSGMTQQVNSFQAIRPESPQLPATQEYQGMQPSVFRPVEGQAEEQSQPSPYPQQAAYSEASYSPQPYPESSPYPAEPAYPEATYPEQGSQDYQYQQYQQPALSSDTITEISEQVVSEKLNEIRKSLEKVIDFRTTTDAKLEYLDERLKRIEKIMDNLQMSILQKVGTYVTNIDDIKKELIETQKSFKSLLPQGRHQSSSPPPGHKPRHHPA